MSIETKIWCRNGLAQKCPCTSNRKSNVRMQKEPANTKHFMSLRFILYKQHNVHTAQQHIRFTRRNTIPNHLVFSAAHLTAGRRKPVSSPHTTRHGPHASRALPFSGLVEPFSFSISNSHSLVLLLCRTMHHSHHIIVVFCCCCSLSLSLSLYVLLVRRCCRRLHSVVCN